MIISNGLIDVLPVVPVMKPTSKSFFIIRDHAVASREVVNDLDHWFDRRSPALEASHSFACSSKLAM
eukprot:12928307-Prorocentrum_lima.AAC.1